jgi:hypothetical protein
MKSFLIDAVMNHSNSVFANSIGGQQLSLDLLGYSEDSFVMTRLKLAPL